MIIEHNSKEGDIKMADLFELLFSKNFEEKIDNELDKVLAESDISTKETINELAEHYLQIIRSIASSYRKIVIDRTDFRQIKIDGRPYDLDAQISHNKAALSEHLSAIDALFSDLAAEGADLKDCIFEIESKLNCN